MEPKAKRVVTVVLALAALALTALVGWRLYTSDLDLWGGTYSADGDRPPGRPDNLRYNRGQPAGEAVRPPATQPHASPLADLAEDVRDPTGEAWTGMKPLAGDPGDLAAPPQSERLSAVRFDTAAGRQERATYLANDRPAVLESFYGEMMKRAGWQFMRRTAGELVYGRPGQTCMISFAAAGQRTKVTVVVASWPD